MVIVTRVILLFAVVVASGTWVFAGSLAWRGQLLADQLLATDAARIKALSLPLAAEPAYTVARLEMEKVDFDQTIVADHLRAALKRQPLHAHYWLDYAEFEATRGNDEPALRHVVTAKELWPTRARLLFRAAQVEILLGDEPAALNTLAGAWHADPASEAGVEAIELAWGLLEDKTTLLSVFLPHDTPPNMHLPDYPARLFEFAIETDDVDFVDDAWDKLPESMKAPGESLFAYIDVMIANDAHGRARKKWHSLIANEDASNLISNGSFEAELINGGLGWRWANGLGFEISRDGDSSVVGRTSLRVTFDGQQNVNFANLNQTVVVQPEGLYRLTGQWRGHDVTTRAGPYIEVRSLDGGQSTREVTEVHWGSWDWSAFSVTVEVPESVRLLQIGLRREKTTNLDNKLGGSIWFDDIQLTQISALATEDLSLSER